MLGGGSFHGLIRSLVHLDCVCGIGQWNVERGACAEVLPVVLDIVEQCCRTFD